MRRGSHAAQKAHPRTQAGPQRNGTRGAAQRAGKRQLRQEPGGHRCHNEPGDQMAGNSGAAPESQARPPRAGRRTGFLEQ
eukprot:10202483-Lingulodinium_polyedra.AAC.1